MSTNQQVAPLGKHTDKTVVQVYEGGDDTDTQKVVPLQTPDDSKTQSKDEKEKEQPSDFEIYCMDIFLQYSEFNDGFMIKNELNKFQEFLDTNKIGDSDIREKLWSKISKFEDSDLVSFVTFAQLLNDAGYTNDLLADVSLAIYDQKFGGAIMNCFCSCFKKCLCFKLRIKGVKSYIEGIVKQEAEIQAIITKAQQGNKQEEQKKDGDDGDKEKTDDDGKDAVNIEIDENEKVKQNGDAQRERLKTKDKESEEKKTGVTDFFQSAQKVQSDISELLDKGSDFYLLYEVYKQGMAIIENPQDNLDDEGNWKWNKWSYQIVIISMFLSLASNYLISFSSFIYLLLYKGYYNPESFKRLNCCQALSRFMILTFLGPSVFLLFQASQVLFTIVNFFALFLGKTVVDSLKDRQWRFYELNFGLNIQEFDGFTLQQKIAQLFFSSLPTTITNILIINKVLDCAELVEETPKAIYLSLVMSFLNIFSTLIQIYMESRGFEEGYLTYSMNCMNAKNGWIPFIHKIQSGNLDQSLNYLLLYCIQPQLTSKVCYYKKFSYQFNDQTIQSLAQDLNLWQQNRTSGIFSQSSVKYWLQLGGSVKNVSVTQLHQLLSGLDNDLIEVSLQNINWKRSIQNAKESGHILHEKGKKYDARTASHVPLLQICMDAEGQMTEKQDDQEKEQQNINEKLDVSIKLEDTSKINVESSYDGDSDDGEYNISRRLLNDEKDEKWACRLMPNQTYVEFDFREVIDLEYFVFTFAKDEPGRDPFQFYATLTMEDGEELETAHTAQTDKVPERFGKERFNFLNTKRCNKVKFLFYSNRYNDRTIQLNQIEFYVKNPDFKKVELKIQNLSHRVSYKKELMNCFEALVSDGTNLEIKNIQGDTMLAYAIKNMKFESFKKLLSSGADINQESEDGKTPLQAVLEMTEDREKEPLYNMLRGMIQNKVDLTKKIIDAPEVSSKKMSAIHFICKRMRIDHQQLRDGNIGYALEDEGITFDEDGEVRQRIFRQMMRCFRLDSDSNEEKFRGIFPNIIFLIKPVKFSEQTDTKGNSCLHILLKEFSGQTLSGEEDDWKGEAFKRKPDSDEEEGEYASSVSISLYMKYFKGYLEEYEPEHTKRSLFELLSTKENNKGQWPIEVAMENENFLGILFALRFLKIEQVTEQKEKVITDWLIKQGSRNFDKVNYKHKNQHGWKSIKTDHPLVQYWVPARNRLKELIDDKEKFDEIVLEKAYETENYQLVKNFEIEDYDDEKLYEKDEYDEEEDRSKSQNSEAEEQEDDNEEMEAVTVTLAEKKADSENWRVIFFIFVLEFSATFDLAGDILLLWAMLQKDTAWATFTLYCMITPYFVSYAPLINYQIESWRVKLQEGLQVTGRMKALAWITLTPIIIIYVFLMDVAFLLISSVLTPIFFFIHLFSCGKFNFTKMLDSTDRIYEKMFEMKRLDVNGFRRLRTISQLVFESIPQILLQCYILRYSLQQEVTLDIDQSVIYGSVIMAFLHMCMEASLLYFEAKACRTSFIHYLLICLNGRLGWVPFTNILQDPQAPKLTAKEILDFDNISASTLCGKYSLEYEFGDKTASTLAKEIMLLQQSSEKMERPCLKIGASINKVSFCTFLNLIFFSYKRVNLDIDDVDFENMFRQSQKYVTEVDQAKEAGEAGQFILSIVQLGYINLLKMIIKVCQLELSKVSDSEKLVAIAQRNKEFKMVEYLLETVGIEVKPRAIKADPADKGNVPEGYRHVYIDEIQLNEELGEYFEKTLGPHDIIAVKNGWTEGYGYDGKSVKDMGKRASTGGVTWMYINEAYPIIPEVQKIYGLNK